MLEAMDSSINIVTIHIQLLNEGTTVYRPTQGRFIENSIYEVQPTSNYSVSGEEWEFPPGSLVECVFETRDNKIILIAKRNAVIS
jgi:hypothetical protein